MIGVKDRSSGSLSLDTEGWIYRNLNLNLLQLYFLTGFISDMGGYNLINKLILIVFLFFAFRAEKIIFSPLLCLYGIMTFLSLLNHAMLYAETGVLEQTSRTMPVIFLLMLACRICTVPGLFVRAVTLNTLPLVLLLLIGGVEYSGGRFTNEYLPEYMHGILPQMVFAVGLWSFLKGKPRLALIVVFFASCAFMTLSTGRRYFIFMFIAIAVALLREVSIISNIMAWSQRRLRLSKILTIGILLSLAIYTLLPQMITSQKRRFGEDFRIIEHIQNLVSGETNDRSSMERKRYWIISVKAANDRWFGFGNGNFPYILEKYGGIFRSWQKAGHPHGGLADSLVTAGYPGSALYMLILFYLIYIGRKDSCMHLCLIWLILQVFIQSIFADKILWPLMAIAERELQMSMNGVKKSVVDSKIVMEKHMSGGHKLPHP